MFRFVALCVGLAVSAAGVAHAKRIGVIARAVDDAPVDGETLGAQVAAVTTPDVAVLAPIDVARERRAAGAVARERLDALGRARDLVREGWTGYLQVEPEFAESRLAAARQALQDVIDLDGAPELLADASIRLAAVRLYRKRPDEARAAFALAASLDADRELSAQEFAPEVISAFEAARTAKVARAPLAVKVDAAGATIEVDGVAVASSPVEVTLGDHVVVARAPGRLPVGQIVTVPPRGTTVELVLLPDVVGDALAAGEPGVRVGRGSDDLSAALAATMTYAELDELWVVAATWQGGEPAFVGQRCAGAPLRCTDAVEVRFREGAAVAAVRELREQLLSRTPAAERGASVFGDRRVKRPEPPRGRGGAPITGRRRWWKNPWVWAGVGAVVVAAGATVWLLSDDDTPERGFFVPPGGFGPTP